MTFLTDSLYNLRKGRLLKRLEKYQAAESAFPDDDLALAVCDLAMKGNQSGNYGIGCIL